MKMKFRRFLSEVMAVVTLASVMVQPVSVSVSEAEPEKTSFEHQYPELKEVQDNLDAEEIVKANDRGLFYGEEFEVEVDLSGIRDDILVLTLILLAIPGLEGTVSMVWGRRKKK